jgi:hypothetical protein
MNYSNILQSIRLMSSDFSSEDCEVDDGVLAPSVRQLLESREHLLFAQAHLRVTAAPPCTTFDRSLARCARTVFVCEQDGQHRRRVSLQRGAAEHRACIPCLDHLLHTPGAFDLDLRYAHHREARSHHRAVCRPGRRDLHAPPPSDGRLAVLPTTSRIPANVSLARLGQQEDP